MNLASTTLPLRPQAESNPTSPENLDASHNFPNSILCQYTNEPLPEVVLRNESSLDNLGNISNGNQYTYEPSEEPVVDSHGHVLGEGTIINPINPVRIPYLSKNVAKRIGNTSEKRGPIILLLNVIQCSEWLINPRKC